MIVKGHADSGLAIQAVAGEQLDFIPLVQERFDLVVPEAFLSPPALRTLLVLLASGQICKNIGSLGGYVPAHAGDVFPVLH